MKTRLIFVATFLAFSFSGSAQDKESTQDSCEKCYEISGELEGKNVMHYFNPVSGTLVESLSQADKK